MLMIFTIIINFIILLYFNLVLYNCDNDDDAYGEGDDVNAFLKVYAAYVINSSLYLIIVIFIIMMMIMKFINCYAYVM